VTYSSARYCACAAKFAWDGYSAPNEQATVNVPDCRSAHVTSTPCAICGALVAAG
jgi:hypothetical protein